jgi:L-seryl-tRNA(Ser) seleniumtransferase
LDNDSRSDRAVSRVEAAVAPPPTDGFGNTFSPGLPYARGSILNSGEAEFLKLAEARRHIRQRVLQGGREGIFDLSGLERGMQSSDQDVYSDELSAAMYWPRLQEVALAHLGGDATRHGILVCNRQSAALFAALMVMVTSSSTVVGFSPSYSHPAVTRPVALLGARFVDTNAIRDFELAINEVSGPVVAVLTRLPVSYAGVLSLDDLQRAIALCQRRGIPILVDDAGGARVAPAVFGQPRALQLGVDVATTGLDKYGTLGPRLGLMGGRRDLVAAITTTAFQYGLEARPMLYAAVIQSLEQYDEERVRDLTASTGRFGEALHQRLGSSVTLTPIAVKIEADKLLALVLARSGMAAPPIVPYEATAAVAMLLLRDYGILTVHFAGLPPGTAALLFKFTPPEVLDRLGGVTKVAGFVDAAVDQVGEMLRDPDTIRELLVGGGTSN